MAWVQSLAQEILHAVTATIKKKKKKELSLALRTCLRVGTQYLPVEFVE